jgi:hypothetical protein
MGVGGSDHQGELELFMNQAKFTTHRDETLSTSPSHASGPAKTLSFSRCLC